MKLAEKSFVQLWVWWYCLWQIMYAETLRVTAEFSVHASLKYEHTAADQNEFHESLEEHLKEAGKRTKFKGDDSSQENVPLEAPWLVPPWQRPLFSRDIRGKFRNNYWGFGNQSREVTVPLCSLRACCESGGASLMQFLHDNQTFALCVGKRELEAPLRAC